MEITGKGLVAVIIPTLITACFTTIDNSLRWRAEMEQKQFDRQTKLLDQIISIPDASHRRSLAEFYISTGVFTGGYLKQLESTLTVAQETAATTNTPDVKSSDQLEQVLKDAIATSGLNVGDELDEYLLEPNAGMSAAPVVDEEPIPILAPEPVMQTPPVQNIFLYDNLKQ